MASTVPYVPNTAWADGSGGGTPITAAKLNTVEQGMTDAHLQPCVRVFNNATIAIASGAGSPVALTFNSERFDQVGGTSAAHHSTSVNTSRLTCLYAGVYQISGTLDWAPNATGFRRIHLRVNGTTTIARVMKSTVGAGSEEMIISSLYALAVNDYVELLAEQNSGVSLNIQAGSNYSPEFMMVRVG